MRVTINNVKENRKLVAVVGSPGNGLFLKERRDVLYLGSSGLVPQNYKTLEDCLRADSTRKPVYEGDEITIQF